MKWRWASEFWLSDSLWRCISETPLRTQDPDLFILHSWQFRLHRKEFLCLAGVWSIGGNVWRCCRARSKTADRR